MRTELSPSSPVSADYCQKQKQNCKCAQTDVRTLNGVYLIHCHVHQPGQKCERQQAQDEGAGLDFHRQGRLRRRALPGRQTGSEPTFKDTISLEWFHFDLNLENWQFPVHLVQLRNLPHPNFTSPVVSATVATNGKHLAGQCPLGILTLPFENLQNVTFVSGLDFDAPALWCSGVTGLYNASYATGAHLNNNKVSALPPNLPSQLPILNPGVRAFMIQFK